MLKTNFQTNLSIQKLSEKKTSQVQQLYSALNLNLNLSASTFLMFAKLCENTDTALNLNGTKHGFVQLSTKH